MAVTIASPNRRPLGNITNSPRRPTLFSNSACFPRASAAPLNPYPAPPSPYSPPQHIIDAVSLASNHYWGVETLRPRQSLALASILHNKQCDRKLLFVDRTGGGKSHVMRLLGTLIRGIILVTAPTLALAADVFQKFRNANESTGPVDAIHFDETHADDDSRLQLVEDLLAIKKDTKRTIFLFVSPQKLAKHRDLRDALMCCNRRGIFRAVLIDEFHMHCQHGIDFRKEVKFVFNEFIRPLMKRKISAPYLLACTATCSLHNIHAFHKMSGVDFTPRQRVWSPAPLFQQRNITMSLQITSQFSQRTAALVVDLMKRDDSSSFAVFTNIARLAEKLHAAIEDAFDSANQLIDVVLVHGAQSPEEKFHFCRAFCTLSTTDGHKSNIKGLVGTSSCDTGLDHPSLVNLILCQLPRDLLSFIQRRGRAGRHGEESTCHLMISFSDFSFTAIQILEGVHKNPTNEHMTSTDRQQLSSVKLSELMCMLKLVAMKGACWHSQIENYCARGYLSPVPRDLDLFPNCETKCPICTNDWQQLFKPVSIQGFIAFMDLEHTTRALPINVTSYNTDEFIQLFWSNPKALKLIFDRQKGTIKQYHVQAFALQLFAAGMFEFSDVKADGKCFIRVVRDQIRQQIRLPNGELQTKYSYLERFKNYNAYWGFNVINDGDRTNIISDILK